MLAAKYSLSLDMRDLDAHVNLFAARHPRRQGPLGRAPSQGVAGRDTLREQFTGTSHHIGGHIIEFSDRDHAHGVVYSKNEHESGERVGDHADALLGRLRAHRRPLVLPPPPAVLLVCHGSEQAADR